MKSMMKYKVGVWSFIILTLFAYAWTIFSILYLSFNDVKL